MSKSDLTVISVVENDPGLLELMLASVCRFTHPVPKFIICDNTNGSNEERIKKANTVGADIEIVNNAPSMSGGSMRHGHGLNRIFPLVKTTRTAIIESDCIVLKNDWDKLDMPTYKMLAALKGKQAGQPFYHICFMVFSTGILKHGNIVDFMPGQESNRFNRTFKPWEDVGWQIRNKVRDDQVKLLTFIDCKSGSGRIFSKDFQSDEFWLDNEPIVAHFGRGSNLGGKAVRKGFEHPTKQLERWKNIALKNIGG